MVTIKALDELTLADLWREALEDEDFWRETQERQRRLVKQLHEEALEAEPVGLLGASRYRRTEVRQGYRNGFYQRDLATHIGIVKGIRVPRARTSVGEREVFRRYHRRQAQVNALIREVTRFHQASLSEDVVYLFLDGVSMRVRGAVGVKRRVVLCAYGITPAAGRSAACSAVKRPRCPIARGRTPRPASAGILLFGTSSPQAVPRRG